MKLNLKICGMRDAVNIAEVAALKPDYMGFIFYNKSPRYVGKEFELPETDGLIKKVGVFVNEENDRILETVKKYKLDFVQLHGTELPAACKQLKRGEVKVIKAFSVDAHFDFESVKSYTGIIDYLLFDTKGKYFGGNAVPFDWTLLRKYDQSIPFILSGGISANNISKLKEIENLNLHAIDVNSGVEISPGIKDVNKIDELKRVLDSL